MTDKKISMAAETVNGDVAAGDLALRQQLWDNLQRDPDDFAANFEMAVYCATRRQYMHLAEPYLVKVVAFGRIDAATQHALLYLGKVYTAQARLELAERVLKILLTIDPNHTGAHFEMAYVLLLKGEMDAASGHFEAVNAIPAARAKTIAAATGEPITRTLSPTNILLDNFGELATNIDFLVKARRAGWITYFRAVLLATQAKICNQTLLDYVGDFVTVVRDADVAAQWLERWPDCEFHMQAMPGPDGRWSLVIAPYRQLQAWWMEHDLPPVFQVKKAERERGEAALAELGVPRGAWFATLHVREPKLYDIGRPYDPVACRNARIETYLGAIQAITDRGGWVVRIGDDGMTPLPSLPRVIDSATQLPRRDWFDIFAIGTCRFFVGVASGPLDTALAFGVPVVATNWFPPPNWPVGPNLIFVPKLLRRTADGSFLSFRESCAPPLAYNIFATAHQAAGVEIVDNDPSDIEASVIEMMDRLDGSASYTADDKKLSQAFAASADPYGLGGPWHVGRDFLRAHANLLEDDRTVRRVDG